MKYTGNYSLKKPEGTDVVNIDDFNENADIIDAQFKSLNDSRINYAVASGTNTYTVTISGITSLVEGLSVKIKFTNANTGASTLNINGLGAKEIRKGNGNALSSGNIKAGQICHLVYTGSNFQLLGEGGEYGTAQPQHVLEGYTIGTEEGIKSGTIPIKSAATIIPGITQQTIAAGQYLGGAQTIDTLGGNAPASAVLSEYTFSSNAAGRAVAGTMPNQGAKVITPSTVNQAIPTGYHNGSGYVKGDSNLVASNIKNGVSIFGITGTYKGMETDFLYSNLVYDGEITGTYYYNPSHVYPEKDRVRFSVNCGTSYPLFVETSVYYQSTDPVWDDYYQDWVYEYYYDWHTYNPGPYSYIEIQIPGRTYPFKLASMLIVSDIGNIYNLYRGFNYLGKFITPRYVRKEGNNYMLDFVESNSSDGLLVYVEYTIHLIKAI